MIVWLLKKLFRKKSFVGPVEPDPPPWDVPLDQTTAELHFEGDIGTI